MRSGKEHWLEARSDFVSAKGKGILRTFFITPLVDKTYSADSRTPYSEEEDEDILNVDFSGKLADKLLRRQREVEWVSELIRDSVREIVAHREIKKGKGTKFAEPLPSHRSRNRTPLDEVVDVIEMPAYSSKAANAKSEAFAIKIPDRVSALIREYVSIVSILDDDLDAFFETAAIRNPLIPWQLTSHPFSR